MDEKNSYMDRILTVPCCNNNSAMEATENRLNKLEETTMKTNELLETLIQKMKENKLF